MFCKKEYLDAKGLALVWEKICAKFLTIEDFNTEIAKYLTIEDFNTEIAKYLTIEDFNEIIVNYVTNDALTEILGDYVTNEVFEGTLNHYVTHDDLSLALTDYVTNNALDVTLSKYVTKDDLSSSTSNYVTQSWVEDYVMQQIDNSTSGNITHNDVLLLIKESLEGYATQEWVLEQIASIEVGDGGLTESQIRSIIESYGYATIDYVNEAIKDITGGGLTEDAVRKLIEEYLSGYVTQEWVENYVNEAVKNIGGGHTDEQINALIQAYLEDNKYATQDWVLEYVSEINQGDGITLGDVKNYLDENGYITATDFFGFFDGNTLKAYLNEMANYDDLHIVFPIYEGNTRKEEDNVFHFRRIGGESIFSTDSNGLTGGIDFKTINGESILGSGDIEVSGGSADLSSYALKSWVIHAVNEVTRQTHITGSGSTLTFYTYTLDNEDTDITDVVSQVGFKTINGENLIGSGNIVVGDGSGGTDIDEAALLSTLQSMAGGISFEVSAPYSLHLNKWFPNSIGSGESTYISTHFATVGGQTILDRTDDIPAVLSSSGVTNIEVMTAAEYAALGTKSNNVIYCITD